MYLELCWRAANNRILPSNTFPKLKFNFDLQFPEKPLKGNMKALVEISALLQKWWTAEWRLLCAVYRLVYQSSKSIFKFVLPGKEICVKSGELSREKDRQAKKNFYQSIRACHWNNSRKVWGPKYLPFKPIALHVRQKMTPLVIILREVTQTSKTSHLKEVIWLNHRSLITDSSLCFSHHSFFESLPLTETGNLFFPLAVTMKVL